MIVPQKGLAQVRIERVREDGITRRRDVVAVEEPLEIRIQHGAEGRRTTDRVSITMRTPGADFELAAGFLFSEGFLTSPSQLQEISYCRGGEPQEYNVVEVRLQPGVEFSAQLLDRNFYTTSSCGVCGKASLEAVELKGCSALEDEGMRLSSEVIRSLPDSLREAQRVFDRTGGQHAAGLFTATGERLGLREDVGRHNAVDKVVGRLFLEGELPASHRVLVVSGRTSFDILQKVLAAGIPFVVAVGAPSSLAVDLARRFGITLVGFTKASGFNVYSAPFRVDVEFA